MADDPEVGRGPSALPRLPERGLVVVEGEFGSGKSVTAERLHQDDVAAASQDSDAPVPVYLDAKSVPGPLVGAVATAAEPVGDVHRIGMRLVLDGLDDVSVTRACELIDQARVLALSLPRSRAVATARPGLPDLRPSERVTYPPMDREEAELLAQRISGGRNWAPTESDAVREALRLPLFVIIATLSRGEGRQVPSSRIDFLENLVTRALRRPRADRDSLHAALVKLARLTIDSGGPVPAGEIGSDAEIQVLTDSRLVVRRGRTIAFGLPVLEQYFGGAAVLEHGLPEHVLDSPTELERWRYPLALAIAAAGWDRSITLVEPVLSRHPGIAAWLLHEGIPDDGRGSSVPVPSAARCGQRIHHALAAMLPAFAPATHLMKIGGFGSAAPRVLGVRSDGHELLAVARHTPVDGRVGVMRLPQPLDWDGLKGFQGPDGAHKAGRPPADYAAWPWRWSLDWITRELTTLIQRKALHTQQPGPAALERRWALCRAVTNQNSFLCAPIRAADIISLLHRLTDNENLMTCRFSSGLQASGAELRNLLQTLEAGDGHESETDTCTAPTQCPTCQRPRHSGFSGTTATNGSPNSPPTSTQAPWTSTNAYAKHGSRH